MSSISNLRQATSLLAKAAKLLEGNTAIGAVKGAPKGVQIHARIKNLHDECKDIQREYDEQCR